jgi:hypothetical protein
VSKPQIHLLNLSYVDEEDEFTEEDCLVDWVSPPIYDIYCNKKSLLEEVSFVVEKVKFFEKKKKIMTTMCLMKAYNMKDLSWVMRKLVMLISLRLKIFYLILLLIIWMLVSVCWMTFFFL